MTVTLHINGREHRAPRGQLLIEACRDAGVGIPRYCYHPGLPVVGSCRMCLVELEGSPKLVPSCQTPVRDAIKVLTHSDRVLAARRGVMEYLLANHPLDCPVCDQAGECYLQDYSYQHGAPLSRFVESKITQPKKDVGRHILLYMDRCVLCSRCVRFCRNVSGSSELCVVDRGSRSEIDIFPGRPVDNKLSGNVADVCPVGALLDKHFLHLQRVWLLQATPSTCARCATGCSILIFHNAGRIWRLRPRTNLAVNGYWMCDEGRYGWDYVHARQRLDHPPRVRTAGGGWDQLGYQPAARLLRQRLAEIAARAPGEIAGVLSPFWTTEEQFMLARLLRQIDPKAILAAGPAPSVGRDETFASGFTIRAEKCPNRLGAERVLAAMGGPTMTLDALLQRAADGQLSALYLAGGYPPDIAQAATGGQAPDPIDPSRPPEGCWLGDDQLKLLNSRGLLLIVHDLFAHPALAERAWMVLAGGSWAEKNGTFAHIGPGVGRLAAAPVGPQFARPDGEFLHLALGGQDDDGGPDLPTLWQQMTAAGVEGYPPPDLPPARPTQPAQYHGPSGTKFSPL